VYRVLVGDPEGKTTLGRPRHRWEEYIFNILRKSVGRTWTAFIWLRIGTSVRLL
jgi:hypothetical protein